MKLFAVNTAHVSNLADGPLVSKNFQMKRSLIVYMKLHIQHEENVS